MPPPNPFNGLDPSALTPVYYPGETRIAGYIDRAGRQYRADGTPVPYGTLPRGQNGYPDWNPDTYEGPVPNPTGVSGGGPGASVGPTYNGTTVNIPKPSGRSARSLVPPGFELVEDAGDHITVRRAGGPAAPAGTPGITEAKQFPQTIWLNGTQVTVTVNADGTWTATPVGGGAPIPTAPPSAFDALDGASIDPASPYVVTPGAARPPGVIGPVAPREMMTIQTGVQWFANLSTADPEAYNVMLDKLLSAGYITRAEHTAAKGHWSAAAGQAFALAARDVAVVNTTPDGADVSLTKWLDSKQGTLEALEAEGGSGGGKYEPIDRQYTDPEALAASSEGAAESALGRKLSDAEEAELTGRFRGLEDQMYDTIDAAAGNGGAVITQPNAGGQIDAYLDSGPREQEQANWATAGYGQALLTLFGVR